MSIVTIAHFRTNPYLGTERLKDRNVIAFAVLCRQEPKVVDTNHPNGAGSKVLNSYGALRTFMQNNPVFGGLFETPY